MRRIAWGALLVVVASAPLPAQAQQRGQSASGDPRVARLTDELREEMWGFRQELDFFRQVPEYSQLVELRYQIRTQAIDLVKARDFNDPGARRLARQMERSGRELYHLAEHLEDRLDPSNRAEVRRRADSLHEHAVEIRVLIGRLHEVIHLDPEGDNPRGRPRFPIQDDRR